MTDSSFSVVSVAHLSRCIVFETGILRNNDTKYNIIN